MEKGSSNVDQRIAEVMEGVVSRGLSGSEITEMARSFIRYKKEEGFSFAKLTQLHFHMFSEEEEALVLYPSAAVELLILSLDIFDDLQDQDASEKPWCQVPHAMAMNISSGLLMLSMKTLEEAEYEPEKKHQAIQYLYSQVLKAVSGQHVDLKDAIETDEQYLQMVESKSGALMACACLVGTSLATNQQHHIVEEYSTSFGVAAQLANDLEDVSRWDTKNDLLFKKKTLPILKLLQQTELENTWLHDYYQGLLDKEFILDHKQEIFTWIQQSPALKYAEVIKRVYQRKASNKIQEISAQERLKKKLQDLIEEI
ncbi:polyprenyl synthetase family protein [Pontibacillus yanchengensis]|nr:polyprenyl synthetase family protein [Pontibacillus yanchengensis]